MKVRKNTDHTLIVEDTPWLFAIMIVLFILVFTGVGLGLILNGEWMGLAFVGFGIFIAPIFLYVFVRRVQVVFYRPEGWVEIRRANLLRTAKSRYDLDEVKGAILESSRSDDTATYRVTLIMEVGGVRGQIPITVAYSNVGKHQDVTDAINTWLA